MAIVVLAHGGWSAGWAWKKVRPLMAAAGHQFFTPTYTGLGERAHLANPSNDLETHIEDVKQVNGQWLVAGTSGAVYPAANFVRWAGRGVRKYYIGPEEPMNAQAFTRLVLGNAGAVMPGLVETGIRD